MKRPRTDTKNQPPLFDFDWPSEGERPHTIALFGSLPQPDEYRAGTDTPEYLRSLAASRDQDRPRER